MAITTDQKARIVGDYQRAKGDTGSPEVQIALLTARINELTDISRPTSRIFIPAADCCGWCRRRRKLLDYLKRRTPISIAACSTVWACASRSLAPVHCMQLWRTAGGTVAASGLVTPTTSRHVPSSPHHYGRKPLTPIKKSIPFGRHTLTLETGEIARQAHGAVMVNMDDTWCWSPSSARKTQSPDRIFFRSRSTIRSELTRQAKFPAGSSSAKAGPQKKKC